MSEVLDPDRHTKQEEQNLNEEQNKNGELNKEKSTAQSNVVVDADQIYHRIKIKKPPRTFTTTPSFSTSTSITPADQYKKAADSYKKSSDTYKWIAIGLGIFIMYQFYRDG